LVQITHSDAIKVNSRFQDVMDWRKVCSLTYQGVAIHDNFDIQSQTARMYSVSKSRYFQLKLEDEFDIEFQDEKYRMNITKTALVRAFIALSYKVNDDQWNYVRGWESYEVYDSTSEVARHQMSIQDGISKEILPK
jgi:hypothetical protein